MFQSNCLLLLLLLLSSVATGCFSVTLEAPPGDGEGDMDVSPDDSGGGVITGAPNNAEHMLQIVTACAQQVIDGSTLWGFNLVQ